MVYLNGFGNSNKTKLQLSIFACDSIEGQSCCQLQVLLWQNHLQPIVFHCERFIWICVKCVWIWLTHSLSSTFTLCLPLKCERMTLLNNVAYRLLIKTKVWTDYKRLLKCICELNAMRLLDLPKTFYIYLFLFYFICWNDGNC